MRLLLPSLHVLTICLIITHHHIQANQTHEEASALLKWKQTLERKSQSVLVSWTGNNPCHFWFGITCSNTTSQSFVTAITLFDLGLKGSLHHLNFASFRSLQVLDLHNNLVSGSIPSNLANISQVIKFVNLGYNKFSGEIPLEIGMLESLEWLGLYANKLSGNIPNSIGNLTKLTRLYLQENELTGPIPKEIGMLDYLVLSYNNFTGTIPSSLGNLTRLRYLDLGYNKLSGTIPRELVGAKNLLALYIPYNFVTGIIPVSFRNFTELQGLDLSSNSISGFFPKEINLSKISHFSVDNNMISGPLPIVGELIQYFEASNNMFSNYIPKEFGKASVLYSLDLSRNRLSGTIPDSFSNLTSLEFLNLDDNLFHGSLPKVAINTIMYSIKNNSLTGEIPFSICNSTHLEVFHVSDNKINGTLPDCFKIGSNLTSLNLNGNLLQGLVPRSLKNCKSLQVLDLGNNMLRDMFLYWLDDLPELRVVVLKNNQLHGVIQTSRSHRRLFPKLQILDLSRNMFRGHIPSKYFESFKAMITDQDQDHVDPPQKRKVSYVGRTEDGIYNDSVKLVVKGMELTYQRILTVLTAIDLSSNKFEGEIPRNIRLLNVLHFLNVSHNLLTGPIPIEFGNLTLLESLDLSSNRLDGNIPTQLTTLTFLEDFNVSFNKLSGAIPKGGQFETFGNQSYLGNSALCGFPLSNTCRVTSMTILPPQQEEDDDDDDGSRIFFDGFTWKSLFSDMDLGF